MNPKIPARLLSFLLAVPAVAATREAFDLAAFEAPPGWERLESPGQLTFRAPTGDGQVSLFGSFETSASPADNFAAEWQRLITTPLGVAAPPPTIETSPEGWTAVLGSASVAAQDSNLGIVQVTTTGFGRAMSIVAAFAADERLAEVTRFFDSVELETGSGVEDVVDGGLAGLFWRVRVGTYGSANVELDTRTFFANDRITRMFPFGGGDSFDTSRCIPDSCGSYELSAGVLNVHWDDGRLDSWPIEVTPEGITLDGTLFRPAQPMSAAKLVGEWADAQAGGNVYHFQSDGTFAFGAGGSMLHGRYAVEQLTLVLQFDDGDVRRRTLFAASPQDPPGMIAVDDEAYARRGTSP